MASEDGPVAGAESSTLERLGGLLTEARISRGLDRATLASQLRMGVEQLQALETADRAHLPESVFVIAQARRVATHLGIDISALVAELKQANGTSNHRPRRAGIAPPRSRPPETGGFAAPSRTVPWAAAAALITGVIAASVWAWPRLQQHTSESTSTTAQRQRPAASIRPVAPPPLPATSTNGLVLRSSQPSWLEVRGSGERVLFRGTLRGEQRFALDQPVRVLAGRPDLVTVVVAGGTPRPLGRIQDIRWVVIRGTPGAPAR